MATSGGGQISRTSYEEMRCAELLALPPQGSQVFISGLAHNTTEESLRMFCEPVGGEVYEIKLRNNGCAFVTFSRKITLAMMKELNNRDKMLRLSLVPTDHWLSVQNVPERSSQEELESIFGPGVMKIENSMDSHDQTTGPVSLFVEYYNNACAEYAKKKLSASDFKLDGNKLAVSWASVPQGAKKPGPAQQNLTVDPYGAYGCGPGNNKPLRTHKTLPLPDGRAGYILNAPYVRPQPSSTQGG